MPRVPADDWRRGNQERFLGGKTFRHLQYERWSEEWDHDHCSFCWETFRVEDGPYLHVGWATDREGFEGEPYHWVCETCFEDFREEFGFLGGKTSKIATKKKKSTL